jgi:hypothetical protein
MFSQEEENGIERSVALGAMNDPETLPVFEETTSRSIVTPKRLADKASLPQPDGVCTKKTTIARLM